MKHLYLIGGTMGVGKTTVCRILKKSLENSVFLDGDWCWDAHPFHVTDETKKMVTDNICHLLNNFLHCSAYEHIIFCWVMHEQSIIDGILQDLDTQSCKIHTVSLICSPESLTARLQKDIDNRLRSPDIIPRSTARLPLYEKLKTERIDVSTLTPEETAKKIIEI